MERASTNIVEKCKYVTLETFWENQCNSNVSQAGVWGRSPQLLGDFFLILEKKAILMPLNHTSHMFRTIWKH